MHSGTRGNAVSLGRIVLRNLGSTAANRILNDYPARPRTCPFLEDLITRCAILKSGHKTLLSLFLVCCQHECQQVKTLHVVPEDPAKVAACCVESFPFFRYLLHICKAPFITVHQCLERARSRTQFSGVRHFWASCCRTCFVSTPLQRNFAPSCISSKIAASPAESMTVALVKSMTVLRPVSESPASFQTLRSSGTHGLVRVPSTTRLLSSNVSIVEILNI